TRLRRRAGKEPKAHALCVDLQQVGEARDRRGGPALEALVAIEEMLCRVVRRIADERLRIDHEPRLTLRGEDVSGMEVGCEEDRSIGRVRKLVEERESLPDEAWVRPQPLVCKRLRRP